MIYIDIDELDEKIDEAWRKQAKDAADAVERVPSKKERAELIKKNSKVWAGLKHHLAGLLHQKCWYCESKNIGSDNAVDHFRPKNAVKECENHPGYWWLAFNWENYRFCCTYCNSKRIDKISETDGGKWDHFPLMEGSFRAASPEDDIQQEQVVLLDPTDPQDPPLLSFNEEGIPVPKYREEENFQAYYRAFHSIYYYHLTHYLKVEERKQIACTIRRMVKQGDRLFKKANRDLLYRAELKKVIRELKKLIKRSAPFSAAARIYITKYEKEHPWIEDVLK